jgi:molybdopterin synthase catalytic subunit
MEDLKRVREERLSVEEILKEIHTPRGGAQTVFVGRVRNENEGKPVTAITYEVYKPMAEKVLKELEEAAKEKFGIEDARIVHRIGYLPVGEVSVVIGVTSKHRKEAFEALRYLIEELKRRVPIWKKEHYRDGESKYLKGQPLKGGSE